MCWARFKSIIVFCWCIWWNYSCPRKAFWNKLNSSELICLIKVDNIVLKVAWLCMHPKSFQFFHQLFFFKRKDILFIFCLDSDYCKLVYRQYQVSKYYNTMGARRGINSINALQQKGRIWSFVDFDETLLPSCLPYSCYDIAL